MNFRSFRPSFMALTVASAFVVTPAVGWMAENLVDERAAYAARLEAIDERVEASFADHGFERAADEHGRAADAIGVQLWRATNAFRLDLAGGRLSGAAAGADARVARIVIEELSRYPGGFLRAHRFRRVLLCSGLEEAGVKIPSLPNLEQSLVLDVDAPDAFLRRLLHHEVFHFMDYTADDQVTRDPEWEALNDRYFVYGFGGRFMRDGATSRFGSGGAGFVTEYAKSGLEEDKAETFAFLLVSPGSMQRQTQRDPRLDAKARHLRQWVQSRDARTAALFGPR